jgi:hypothetical protein
MCAHCIVPEWDRGYLLHREFDRDPAMVTMYDRNGKKVLEARVVPQNAARVSLIAVGATPAGGILAAGGATMTDGSSQRFIAKTDPAGRTVQLVETGRFTVRHVCEVPDGTVWALGFDLDIHDSPDADRNVCATIVSRRAYSAVLFLSIPYLDFPIPIWLSIQGKAICAVARTVSWFTSGQLPNTLKWMPRRKSLLAGVWTCLPLWVPRRVDLPSPTKERLS